MKVLKGFVVLFGLGVTLPIWYYLMYQVMVRVQATEVMWLLFWIYLPIGIITSIMQKIVEFDRTA